jgi:hypothetical protein
MRDESFYESKFCENGLHDLNIRCLLAVEISAIRLEGGNSALSLCGACHVGP